jgi:two-component system heavy metal sensor histidine kinase CusS
VKPLSLRTQLTLFFTSILALLVVALGITYYQVLARQLDADATADLEQITSGLHGYLNFSDIGPSLAYDREDPDQVSFVEGATRYYQVYDAATGELVVQSPALAPLGLHYTPEEVKTFSEAPGIHDMQTDHGRVRLSSSVLSPGTGRTYLLEVGVPLDAMDAALRRFVRLLLWSVPTGLVLALLTGRWMAARALAPLARMAAATRHIDVADLRQRLPVRGTHDELDEVAHAFNDTLTRLDRTMGEMRQFSAAIAHELRTPLAALRGETEVTLLKASSIEDYRRGLTDQLEELDKLARLVSQLMTLARAEAGQIPLARTAVDLSALSLSLVEQLEPVAQARAVTIVADVRPSVIVTGDAGWLERLILNLLDNAIKFTPAQGRIVVRVRSDGESAVLEVEDNGVGIAPEALPHVFERFYRADPARSSSGTEGVGLGLSLVKWIADRHQATLGVQSQPGQGARFTVEFPSLNDN